MTFDPERQIRLRDRGIEATGALLWFDALIRHQIFLIRGAGALRNETNDIINRTERQVGSIIRDGLRGNPRLNGRRIRRARRVLERIKELRFQAWGEINDLWLSNFREFLDEEIDFLSSAFVSSLPVIVNPRRPRRGDLTRLISERPFEGRLLRQWLLKLRNDDFSNIRTEVLNGVKDGLSSTAIAVAVIGSARLRGRNGITQVTRRNVGVIARTGIVHFSTLGRNEFLNVNIDFFDPEIFTAVLDGRTTPICRSLDGTLFPIGVGPMPPLHPFCRSVRISSFNREVLGRRRFNASTERQLLDEFTEQEGIERVTTRSMLPRGFKGMFDRFSRMRIMDLIGVLPNKVTYPDFLRRQSVAFQDQVLGRTKGILFRRGGLTLDKFVDRSGNEIPLRDLAITERQAFIDAGLEPGEFLNRAA